MTLSQTIVSFIPNFQSVHLLKFRCPLHSNITIHCFCIAGLRPFFLFILFSIFNNSFKDHWTFGIWTFGIFSLQDYNWIIQHWWQQLLQILSNITLTTQVSLQINKSEYCSSFISYEWFYKCAIHDDYCRRTPSACHGFVSRWFDSPRHHQIINILTNCTL